MIFAVFSWILLGLAILDVLAAMVLLWWLRAMNTVMHEKSLGFAWGFVVGLPALTIVLAIVALNLPFANHPNSGIITLTLGYVWFTIMAVYQGGMTAAVITKSREQDTANERRVRALQGIRG